MTQKIRNKRLRTLIPMSRDTDRAERDLQSVLCTVCPSGTLCCALRSAQLLGSCLTLCNLWTIARQATLSMASSRQEHCRGLPRPPPGDLPDQGLNPHLLCLVTLKAGKFSESLWHLVHVFNSNHLFRRTKQFYGQWNNDRMLKENWLKKSKVMKNSVT